MTDRERQQLNGFQVNDNYHLTNGGEKSKLIQCEEDELKSKEKLIKQRAQVNKELQVTILELHNNINNLNKHQKRVLRERKPPHAPNRKN